MRIDVGTAQRIAENAVDSGAGVLAVMLAMLSWLVQDLPVVLFGVQLSVVLAGFAGALAIVSFLPAFETRRKMWTTVLVCTVAAAYLTKLALRASNLDISYSLGMAFVIGFAFQLIGTGLVQQAPKLWDAAIARIRGGAQ